jgi:hypothetical protein
MWHGRGGEGRGWHPPDGSGGSWQAVRPRSAGRGHGYDPPGEHHDWYHNSGYQEHHGRHDDAGDQEQHIGYHQEYLERQHHGSYGRYGPPEVSFSGHRVSEPMQIRFLSTRSFKTQTQIQITF